MNQPFKRNYVQHALAVGAWIHRHGARGGIDARTQVMEITHRGKAVRFYPQFVVENADGSMGFSPLMMTNVSGFVSWLPHQGKVWPAAQDKLAFKALAQAAGLRTPKWTTEPDQARGAVLVKARQSTLGRGQRGPFEAGCASTKIALASGEYLEQFIVGRLVKAWFWNDELAVAEVVDMPTVRGDGHRTLRQLIAQHLSPADAWPSALDELAAIQGLTLDAVPSAGHVALADYRYMSALNPAIATDHDVRGTLAGTPPLEAALLAAGRAVWSDVPEQTQDDTVFSLDGIVDRNGELWLLEVNCNPLLHPAYYAVMLDRLFDVN